MNQSEHDRSISPAPCSHCGGELVEGAWACGRCGASTAASHGTLHAGDDTARRVRNLRLTGRNEPDSWSTQKPPTGRLSLWQARRELRRLEALGEGETGLAADARRAMQFGLVKTLVLSAAALAVVGIVIVNI